MTSVLYALVSAVQQTLSNYDAEIRQLIVRNSDYGGLQNRIFQSMQQGPAALPSIANDLYAMATYNHDFYHMAAKGYAGLAKALKRPPMPPQRHDQQMQSNVTTLRV